MRTGAKISGGKTLTGYPADAFAPERWEVLARQGRSPKEMLHFGFGYGPRVCPGKFLGTPGGRPRRGRVREDLQVHGGQRPDKRQGGRLDQAGRWGPGRSGAEVGCFGLRHRCSRHTSHIALALWSRTTLGIALHLSGILTRPGEKHTRGSFSGPYSWPPRSAITRMAACDT